MFMIVDPSGCASRGRRQFGSPREPGKQEREQPGLREFGFSSLSPDSLSAFGNLPSSYERRMVREVIHQERSEFPPLRELHNGYRAEDTEIYPSCTTPQGQDSGISDCPEHPIEVVFTNHAMAENMTRNPEKEVTHVNTGHGYLLSPSP